MCVCVGGGEGDINCDTTLWRSLVTGSIDKDKLLTSIIEQQEQKWEEFMQPFRYGTIDGGRVAKTDNDVPQSYVREASMYNYGTYLALVLGHAYHNKWVWSTIAFATLGPNNYTLIFHVSHESESFWNHFGPDEFIAYHFMIFSGERFS